MDEIVEEFKEESRSLVQDLMEILESVEDDPEQNKGLEEFGQKVDRIMGSAKTMVMTCEVESEAAEYELIGQYSELCKSIGYKGSQISGNQDLVNITVGLLFDATETLEKLIELVGTDKSLQRDEVLSGPFLERLKWLSTQFSDDLRGSLALEKTEDSPKQEDFKSIDEVLDKFFKS
ncbi:MAG: hypothetical protein HRT45_08285 [Bdellovibrionales bacterium]|nr:hypothetical protein [Bdellovibrionales bacterium]